MTSLALGLTAAICWGLADFFAAGLTRKVGVTRALSVATFGALAAYALTYYLFSPRLPVTPFDLLVMTGMGAGTVLVYLSFYRALSHGPLAVVTPVAAAYAAVIVLLSVAILGEKLDPLRWAGAFLAIGGVSLASVRLGDLEAEQKRLSRGIAYAVVAMLGFGILGFMTATYARRYGYIAPAFFVRVVSSVLFVVVAGARRQWPWATPPGLILALMGVGLLDGLGFLAFSRGSEIGLVSIVALASASYPTIPLILGVMVYKERLAPNQWAGVAMTVAGVIAISASG